MMQRLLAFLLLGLLAISGVSCKKDYPKDIPDWLKQRIKTLKKENPCNDLAVEIQEYKGNNETLYLFTKACPFCSYYIFDNDGNLLCENITVLASDSCGSRSMADYTFQRLIWIETCKD
jgi:hypothetical protein